MPDWNELVKARLGPLGLNRERESEIVAELAAHLEQLCEDLWKQGLAEEEAVHQALASVSDWSQIRHDIRLAEKRESTVHQRIRSVWSPGLCAVAICYALLQFMGLVSSKVMAHPASVNVLRLVVLATHFFGLVGTGAGAAYLSRRMGGQLRHQLLGALLPAGILLAALLISLAGLPQAKAAYPWVKMDFVPIAVLAVTCAVVLPLLLGALLATVQSIWSNRADCA